MKKDQQRREKSIKRIRAQRNGDNPRKTQTNFQKKTCIEKIKEEKLDEKKILIFKSTTDPYETPLKWWEKEPIKFA